MWMRYAPISDEEERIANLINFNVPLIKRGIKRVVL